MSKDGTWTAWTFKIGNKAFKSIRPRSMFVEQELTREAVSTRWFFFTKYMLVPTGRWSLVLTYDRGPHTRTKNEQIFFKNKAIAEHWFEQLYNQVFTSNPNHKVPPPPRKRKKPTPVKKKASHLKVVVFED